MGINGGARMGVGPLTYPQFPLHLLSPVRYVSRPCFGGSLLPLPASKISVLEAWLRQRGWLPGGESFIKHLQLRKEYSVNRHRIEDQMVQRHIQAMLLLGHPDQQCTYQRPGFQIHGTFRVFNCQPHGFHVAISLWQAAQICYPHRKGVRRWIDNLYQFLAYTVEGRAPDFVPLDDFQQAPPQHCHIQRTRTIDRDSLVIERNVPHNLPV